MAEIILAAEQQSPEWRYQGTVGYLRIYASTSFYAADGTQVTGGKVGSPNWYQQYTCPVSGGFITIPQVTLQSTTDSTIPVATYTAIFVTEKGAVVQPAKLANFFVDPTGITLPTPDSSVSVLTGGTSAANGIYTYRGLTGGLPYYNLTGQADSTTLYVIKNVSSLWKIYDSAGAILYTSNNNASYPWDVSGWTVTTGSSPAPTVSENDAILTTTWEALTLSNQGAGLPGAPFQFDGPFWSVDQTKQYIASIVGDGTTPYASKLVVGKTELDTDPVQSTRPIAAASNSPRVTKNLVTDYADSLTLLAAETADVLVSIKETKTQTTDITLPDNVLLDVQEGGLLVASNCNIIVGKLLEDGNYQKFDKVGTGTVTLAAGAVSEVNLAWFATQASAGWGMTQCVNSVHSAAKITVPPGVWTGINSVPLPDGIVIEGCGAFPDAGQATVLKKTTNGGAVFTIDETFRNVVIKDLVIDCGTATGAVGVLAQNVVASSGFLLTFERVVFHNGTYSVKVDSPNAWELEQVMFDQCQFIGNTSGAYYCNTVNGSWTFDQCLLSLLPGVDGFNFNYTGTTTVQNTTIQASGAAAGTAFRFTNAHAAVSIINCQDEGLTNFIITDASDYRFPINLAHNVIQSQIQINGSCVINSYGDAYRFSDTYQSAVGASGRVNIYGGSIDAATDQNGTPVVPKRVANFDGTGSIVCTENITTDTRTTNRTPTRFLSPAQLDANATVPVLSAGNYTATSTEKILLRLGRTTIDGTFDYYADIYRANTGKFHVDSNQTGFCNWVWNSDIEVPDEAYGVGWNGSLEVPTKNAVYDKIVAVDASVATNTANIATNTTNIALKANIASPTFTGTVVIPTATITTANTTTENVTTLNATTVNATGAIKSSGTAGVGYAAGAAGTGTATAYAGNNATVTVNKTCGTITLDGSVAYAANTSYTIVVTNSTVAVGDVVVINQLSGTNNVYSVSISAIAAGSFTVLIRSYATPTEVVTLGFAVIKGS